MGCTESVISRVDIGERERVYLLTLLCVRIVRSSLQLLNSRSSVVRLIAGFLSKPSHRVSLIYFELTISKYASESPIGRSFESQSPGLGTYGGHCHGINRNMFQKYFIFRFQS